MRQIFIHLPTLRDQQKSDYLLHNQAIAERLNLDMVVIAKPESLNLLPDNITLYDWGEVPVLPEEQIRVSLMGHGRRDGFGDFESSYEFFNFLIRLKEQNPQVTDIELFSCNVGLTTEDNRGFSAEVAELIDNNPDFFPGGLALHAFRFEDDGLGNYFLVTPIDTETDKISFGFSKTSGEWEQLNKKLGDLVGVKHILEGIELLNRNEQYASSQRQSFNMPFGYHLSDILEVINEYYDTLNDKEHLTALSILKEMIELCQVSGLKLSSHPSLGRDFDNIVENASSLRLTDEHLEISYSDRNPKLLDERSCQTWLKQLSIYNLNITIPGTKININKHGDISGKQFLSFNSTEFSRITLNLNVEASQTQQQMQDIITTNRIPVQNNVNSYDITNLSSVLVRFTNAHQGVSELTIKNRELYDAIGQYRIKLEDDIRGNHRLVKSKVRDSLMFWNPGKPEESRAEARQLRNEKFELLFGAQHYLSMPSSQEAYNQFHEILSHCSKDVLDYGNKTKSLIEKLTELAENDYHLERPNSTFSP
ncbi:MAG: hypothetical protein JJT82_07425 [Legionellaceae bacterium]|nr:hypothetical protein [Legionellaceae bacterium]